MTKGVRGTIEEAIGVSNLEDILIESFRDLVKDEIKRYIRTKIDANPELKEELKQAVEELIQAKVKESLALVKIAKSSAKLGLELIPSNLREEMISTLLAMFEKEVTSIIQKKEME